MVDLNKIQMWFKDVPTPMWVIALGVFVNIVFFSFLWPLNAIYIHNVLGKSMTVTGIVLFVYSLTGFLGNLIGGWLYDRFGAAKVLSMNAAICVPIAASLAMFHEYWTYVGLITVFGFVSSVPFPVLSALVARAWPTGGRRGYNYIYVIFNVGTAVGTALGGVIAQWSFQAVFVILACGYTTFFVIAFTLFRVYFPPVTSIQPSHTGQGNVRSRSLLRWLPVASILSGYGIAWIIYVQWMSIVPVYMQFINIATRNYSVLWTVNGITVVIFQPLINWVLRRFQSFTMQMVAGMPLFGVSFLCLALSHSYYLFVIGMLFLTIGEMLVWPAVPASLAAQAPPGRQGAVQGAVGSFAALGRMVGPLIGGRLYDTLPISAVLLCFALASVLPALLFMVRQKRQAITERAITEGTA
jgi:MFS family permease